MLARKYQISDYIFEPFETLEKVDLRRVFRLNSFDVTEAPIVYLMMREQRVIDNWGILFAQELAIANKVPLICICFNNENTIKAKENFMLAGLIEVQKKLKDLKIPFCFIRDKTKLLDLIKQIQIGAIVTDFYPLSESQNLLNIISIESKIAIFEVDSHNILPARYISKKQEYSAATFRIKVNSNIGEFLTEYPTLTCSQNSPNELIKILESFSETFCCIKQTNIKASYSQGIKELKNFIKNRLDKYANSRNDPNKRGLSNMSPYLHFGQISAQRIALEILQSKASRENQEVYLEELIVRKELADNFCLYSSDYKSFDDIPNWAKENLKVHSQDIRPYLYDIEELEQAKTHDCLWNTAQKELIRKNKIHSYMRMYWAKKILEWARTPEEALENAIYLNDKYSLDGCDPNGYVGILWSIGGLHDRPWQERMVFGKIRYMSYNGAKKKFDTDKYCTSIQKN